MDPLVENEAKLHITNGIEKASSISGVDIKVRRNYNGKAAFNLITVFSRPANWLRSRWTDNTDTRSTA